MLAEGQMRYRGLVIGTGTAYRISSAEGLEGVEARVGDREIPRGDGDVPGDHYLSAKAPILELAVVGARADVLPALQAAFKVSRSRDEPLTYRLPGRDGLRRVMTRVVSMPIRERAPLTDVTEATIALRCSDPRVYSEVENHVQVPLFVTGGDGYFDFPGDFPKDSDTAGGFEAVAHNEGDSDAFPLVRWWGPSSGSASRMRVQNTTNGSEVDVVTAVGVGQILSADMRAYVTGRTDVRIIDLSGASRYGDWVSRPAPLRLSPGDNVLRMTAEGSTDDVRCTVSFRATWDGTVEDANG